MPTYNSKARYAACRTAGVCLCGVPVMAPHVKCDECRADDRKRAEAREAKRDSKVCRCGRKIERTDRLVCNLCLERGSEAGRTKYKKAKELWLTEPEKAPCLRCLKADPMPGRSECVPCWWTQVANSNFRSVKVVSALQKMWSAQGHRCAITGLFIEPGAMELDHKVPLSRGGARTVDNVQWVLPIVNRMKYSLRTEEFVSLCARIVEHNDHHD